MGPYNAGRGGRSTPYGIMECREKGAPLEHLKQWHELREPYWRRWSTLGRPSILININLHKGTMQMRKAER
ncbi:endonuclease/exonuclease/phosphatase family protein [Aspergillus luchuensis]|uniref:Endonuclease/exonuclease/phosphatase family protein n=1 Tax=Aspergillus kawachii TaxID=1069201 RepID=A0A146FI97_ASPKA|nr:endonuclease/exonuclease/phosphatase family protein [Aspergillus luchuensis]